MTVRRPNILLLMTDQQRSDALGCAGSWVRTPHLDRIASEGVRFANCVTVSPECIPARVSLATGLYPHNSGVWENVRYTLPSECATWMQSIRAAGYRTSIFGKTHWHPHEGDLRSREHLTRCYGFDDVHEVAGPRASMYCLSHMTARWDEQGLWEAFRRDYEQRLSANPLVVRPSVLPLNEYYDVYVGQQAVRYFETLHCPQPWFCWVSFPGPHEPWDTPEPWASMYDPALMPLPIPRTNSSAERPVGNIDHRVPVSLSPQQVRRMRADYAGNISLIDDQIGQILEAIERRGELDKTIILFTSDHGEMNGDHGLVYKSNFYQSAVMVPLIIRLPPDAGSAGTAGGIYEGIVENIDIGATLADLAGARLTHRQFSRSLTMCLRNLQAKARSCAISEIFGEVMLTDHDWKAAVNRDAEVYMLFHRTEDPDEVSNLAGDPDHVEIRNRLRVRMLQRILQTQLAAPTGKSRIGFEVSRNLSRPQAREVLA